MVVGGEAWTECCGNKVDYFASSSLLAAASVFAETSSSVGVWAAARHEAKKCQELHLMGLSRRVRAISIWPFSSLIKLVYAKRPIIRRKFFIFCCLTCIPLPVYCEIILLSFFPTIRPTQAISTQILPTWSSPFSLLFHPTTSFTSRIIVILISCLRGNSGLLVSALFPEFPKLINCRPWLMKCF